MARKSAMELLDELQANLNTLREVLSGDRAGWSEERRWYEVLRAFVALDGAYRDLSFEERKAAAQRAGLDPRALSGAFKKPNQDGQFEWADSAAGTARLSDSGMKWYERLRDAHEDW